MGGLTAYSSNAYTGQLQSLLPPGRAWRRDPDAVLTPLLQGWMADGMARLDQAAVALLEESDPSTTIELLADWERNAGLPDTCSGAPDTVFGRQLALAQKLTSRGGQSLAYFVGLAAAQGVEAEIIEQLPFTCESSCEDALFVDTDRFYWQMVVYLPDDPSSPLTATYFTDESSCEDPLDSYGMVSLECLVRRAAPAHTTVTFSYPTEPPPSFQFNFLI